MIQKIMLLPFLIISLGFVVLGVVEIIPTFGLFGMIWTLVAGSFVVIAVVMLVKKNGPAHRVGYDWETDLDRSIVGMMEDVQDAFSEPSAEHAEERLTKLRRLYEQRLITQEEYDAKRREILEQL